MTSKGVEAMRQLSRNIVFTAVSAALCGAAPLHAQVAPGASIGAALESSSGDSTRSRPARRAQARFEDQRLRNLPPSELATGDPQCDFRIGSRCIWRERTQARPDEPRVVGRWREALIGDLRLALVAEPTDGWVTGQLVRYLVETDRLAEAAAAAAECAAERWWCLALAGYVAQQETRFTDAAAHFDASLALMPAAERARWTDLTPLLTEADRAAWAALDASAKRALETRFWWLANPLWSVPANERQTEHYTRHTVTLLLRDAQTPARVQYGNDLEVVILRMGQPVGFSEAPRPGVGGRRTVVTFFEPDGREFLPSLAMAADPAAITAADWPPAGTPDRTEYRPGYTKRVDDLEHQAALFRRGERTLLLLSWALTPRAPLAGAWAGGGSGSRAGEEGDALAHTFIWFRSAPDDGAAPVHITEPPRRHALLHPVEPGTTVVSIEAHMPDVGYTARLRRGVPPPPPAGGLGISDILLTSVTDDPVESVQDALHLARPTVRLTPGERVGLFWELYALTGDDEDVTLSLDLTREEDGRVRRIARALRLAGDPENVGMQWQTRLEGGAVSAHFLELELSDLTAGEYTLSLTVRRDSGESATGSRVIRVVR
jgi:hypothetical protein